MNTTENSIRFNNVCPSLKLLTGSDPRGVACASNHSSALSSYSEFDRALQAIRSATLPVRILNMLCSKEHKSTFEFSGCAPYICILIKLFHCQSRVLSKPSVIRLVGRKRRVEMRAGGCASSSVLPSDSNYTVKSLLRKRRRPAASLI